MGRQRLKNDKILIEPLRPKSHNLKQEFRGNITKRLENVTFSEEKYNFVRYVFMKLRQIQKFQKKVKLDLLESKFKTFATQQQITLMSSFLFHS